jgi:hypothetical protein
MDLMTTENDDWFQSLWTSLDEKPFIPEPTRAIVPPHLVLDKNYLWHFDPELIQWLHQECRGNWKAGYHRRWKIKDCYFWIDFDRALDAGFFRLTWA